MHLTLSVFFIKVFSHFKAEMFKSLSMLKRLKFYSVMAKMNSKLFKKIRKKLKIRDFRDFTVSEGDGFDVLGTGELEVGHGGRHDVSGE